jgi:hypothetical protein
MCVCVHDPSSCVHTSCIAPGYDWSIITRVSPPPSTQTKDDISHRGIGWVVTGGGENIFIHRGRF